MLIIDYFLEKNFLVLAFGLDFIELNNQIGYLVCECTCYSFIKTLELMNDNLIYLFNFEGSNLKENKTYWGYVNFTYTEIYNNLSLVYGFKFTVSILFLIFIRAGLPRYRYDYLTKLGWYKFILLTLTFFISFLVIFSYL